MTEAEQKVIRDLAAPLLDKYHLVEFFLSIKPYRSDMIIDMRVDHAEGGVSLDECAQFNKELVGVLESHQFHNGNFELDVSSPGLDAVLERPKDFKRVVGKRLEVTYGKDGEQKVVSGVLTDAGQDAITMALETGEEAIDLKTIQQAVQQVK